MEVVDVDPFNFITTECLITTAQHDLLSTTTFYRQHDFSPADDDAADYGFSDTWPVSSDDDDDGVGNGVPLPDDNAVEITFCSVPSTPDNQHDVVPSQSDELGFCAENTAPKLNDVVSGNSDELEGLCVQGESLFDLNDVVCGSSDELGFSVEGNKSRCDLNDVVCGDSIQLGFSVERKRVREESSVTPLKAKRKLRFCDDVENTTVVSNDVVLENTEEIPNDVVCESTDDLGLEFCDGDKIDVENTEEVVNDVVCEGFDELGFRGVTNDVVSGNSVDLGFQGERNRTNEEFVSPITTKNALDDAVSGNSVDLGFQGERNTTNEEFVSPTTTENAPNDVVSGNPVDLGFQGERATKNEKFVSPTTTKNALDDVVSGNSVDLGERDIMNEEFTTNSPSTTTELSSPELDGPEMAVESEDTAEVAVIDDEEVIEHESNLNNTEEIGTSCDDSDVDDDTEVVAEEEEELNDSTLDRNSKAETCGNHVNCLMEILKMLAEKSGKEKGDGEVDFLETAKRLGYTFPKPRWMSS